jgi:hypothetical protein
VLGIENARVFHDSLPWVRFQLPAGASVLAVPAIVLLAVRCDHGENGAMKRLRFKTWDSAAGRHENVKGTYEPFPDLAFSTSVLTASAVRRHPARSIAVMRVGERKSFRWGAWDSQTGRLLHSFHHHCADVRWLRDGTELLAAINMSGKIPGRGVPYRLVRLAVESLALIEDRAFGLPQCCIDELVVSPSERLILGFLNSGQGECGYEVFRLGDTIERTNLGQPFTLNVMLSPPAISPDERFIVSATGTGDPIIWWVDENEDDPVDLDTPARGGPRSFGEIVVQDLKTRRLSKHRLETKLKAGWLPADPDAGEWLGPQGPEFVGPRRFRIWFSPARTQIELKLPLPKVVRIPAGLFGDRK